jgi:excisionase family DNA binding protein
MHVAYRGRNGRALGANLHALWNDPAAPVEIKKRILRAVIHEIVAEVNHSSGQVEMRIHWMGGVHTMVRVRKNRAGHNGNATDPNVVELVREWAKAWSDGYIAAMLNRLGHQTGPGNTWNQTRVKNLRFHHKIPVFVEGSHRPWLTMAEAAELLSVSVAVVRTMVIRKLLPARQVTKGVPWMIQREDLTLPGVVSYSKSARSGKAAPREEGGQTLIPYL